MTGTNEQFSQWCVLELMGHRRLAGLVSEQEIAGQAFLRLDIHREAEVITQYYSPSAVYCITPTTEEVARKTAALGRPQPVARWEIEEREPRGHEEADPELDVECPF